MECKCTSFNKYKICRILLDTFLRDFKTLIQVLKVPRVLNGIINIPPYFLIIFSIISNNLALKASLKMYI